jgi:dihydroneopterin aldolase
VSAGGGARMLAGMLLIEIRGLRVHGHHGVLEAERRDGQRFLVDLTLECDVDGAAGSDRLSDTVDYGVLAARVADEVARTRFDLLEALAAHLADLALADGRVAAATVRVAKPDVTLPVAVDEVAVSLRRERPR